MLKIVAILVILALVGKAEEFPFKITSPFEVTHAGNHSLRDFQGCPACNGGLNCCCADIGGDQWCMLKSANPPVFYCLDPSQYYCCPYVPNPNQLFLACKKPYHCANDTTQPSGQNCVSSATLSLSLPLSALAFVATVFVLLGNL